MASREGPGELVQTITLALPMTAGLFLACYLVSAFYLLPAKRAEVEAEVKSYEDLVKLLDSDETRALRQQAAAERAAANDKSLGEVIGHEIKLYGIETERIPPSQRSEIRQGMWEERQTVVTKPTAMGRLVQFAVAVREAKRTIQVDRLRLDRVRGEEDSWKATIDFVDIVTRE